VNIKEFRQPRVTVIVPAYNEEARIGAVICAASSAPAVNEVIVVSDGSTDKTAEVAKECGVRFEILPRNVGKGGAMLHGAKCAAGADIIVFLDADLIGLKPQHIEALVQPVVSGSYAMAIGQFIGGRGVTDLAQLLVKCISGQRAIGRELFLSIPAVDEVGYGVEMLITLHVSGQKLDTKVVTLRGVTHPMKEEKLGFLRGVIARARMYWQMGKFWVFYSFRGRPPRTSSPHSLSNICDDGNIIVGNGSSQDKAVDSVQNAPMSR
jgi:polyisoprenyl-phosphate glycosyltransferase